MKIVILMMAILGLILGCASKNRYHRPEWYEPTKTEKIGAWVPISAVSTTSETAKILRVYPECVDRNTSQGDLYECVREIDIKEGRIKPEDLKKYENPKVLAEPSGSNSPPR